MPGFAMMSFLSCLPLVARNTPTWSLRQVQELSRFEWSGLLLQNRDGGALLAAEIVGIVRHGLYADNMESSRADGRACGMRYINTFGDRTTSYPFPYNNARLLVEQMGSRCWWMGLLRPTLISRSPLG
jgi:hypothetical protein